MTALDLADGPRILNANQGEGRFGHEQHLRLGWALLNEAQTYEDPDRHWSHVNDPTARREWVEPDLAPMP